MKHLLIVLVLSTITDANAHIVMNTAPMLLDDIMVEKPYIDVQSREEREWRRRHYEIPGYAPYTPDYGWQFYPDGRSYFQGTPNRYYREEYPSVNYCYPFRTYGGQWRLNCQ